MTKNRGERERRRPEDRERERERRKTERELAEKVFFKKKTSRESDRLLH